MTMIREGISTGNIDKIYEVSKLDPEVWRENADIVWLENWIEHQEPNWEKALILLALYYEETQKSI